MQYAIKLMTSWKDDTERLCRILIRNFDAQRVQLRANDKDPKYKDDIYLIYYTLVSKEMIQSLEAYLKGMRDTLADNPHTFVALYFYEIKPVKEMA